MAISLRKCQLWSVINKKYLVLTILKHFKSTLLNMKTYIISSLGEIIKPPQFNETMTRYIMEMKQKATSFLSIILMFTWGQFHSYGCTDHIHFFCSVA